MPKPLRPSEAMPEWRQRTDWQIRERSRRAPGDGHPGGIEVVSPAYAALRAIG